MSDMAQGPDWWLASDGKWYPPNSRFPQPPPPPPPPGVATFARAWLSPALTAWIRGLLWTCAAVSLLVLALSLSALS